MTDLDASADADRATAAEPVVSALRNGIPSAEDHIEIDGRSVIRFHPLHRKIKDNIPRCVSCGQIDEDGYHDARYCPGCEGWLPFPTAKLKTKLKSDSGFSAESEQRIHLEQWIAIQHILNAGTAFAQDVVAQAIEARRAEPGTGSVHESAVGETDAPEGDQS